MWLGCAGKVFHGYVTERAGRRFGAVPPFAVRAAGTATGEAQYQGVQLCLPDGFSTQARIMCVEGL